MKYILMIFLCATTFASKSQNSAFELLNLVNSKFKSVHSYKAEIKITTDVRFIKMLPVQATMYFKQPDKLHIETKGIAMLPKQSPQFFLNNINETDYLCIFVNNQLINGINCRGVKVIPLNDNNDLVIATLFIDPLNLVLQKAAITSKTNGTIQMNFMYGKYLKFQLPDEVMFEMDVAKFKLPKVVAADLENTKTIKDDPSKTKRGKITITYKSYQINPVINDNFFESKSN
jgi:hypothetical protein